MSLIDIKIPSPGESVSEVEIATWFVKEGDYVEKNQEIAELESDKATLTLIAEESGTIAILASEGETVEVASIACTIDTSAEAPKGKVNSTDKEPDPIKKDQANADSDKIKNQVPESDIKITPVAQKILNEKGISTEEFLSKLHRITSKEVETVLAYHETSNSEEIGVKNLPRQEDRKKMSSLRKKLSQRLVQVKNQTAMLTTFNEVNMQAVIELRSKYKAEFQEKFGVKLGFMSFFTKAASIALQSHPNVNAMIDGEEIVSFNYNDIGIAVQTPKGLMVPIVRNVNNLSLAQTELAIAEIASKARNGKISLDEMSGGTFTITNGGVFGSLLSTPILNPPQSGILGMHNILERPIAENGKVVIRPMMYVALSYDHRLVDGKDSVGFLVKLKELIENPERMLFNGKDPAESLVLG
jgi:2-oxoglutarate dehydrogenase E2 component (dihydrolipoamide succinyltransferase)